MRNSAEEQLHINRWIDLNYIVALSDESFQKNLRQCHDKHDFG